MHDNGDSSYDGAAHARALELFEKELLSRNLRNIKSTCCTATEIPAMTGRPSSRMRFGRRLERWS